MKDEIKEILDSIQEHLKENEEKFKKGAVDSTVYYLYCDDARTLLDYITNLQEENKRYKKIFEGKERFSKIMPDDTDFIILSKADYDRQQEDIELGLIDYKSRNEKAIELIKKDREKSYDSLEKKAFYCNKTDKLLNILQGENKE